MRHRTALAFAATTFALGAVADSSLFTPKHEQGRCAFRGQCGKKSFFGKELPCVDNGLAHDPDEELRAELVDLCGQEWSEGPVCCTLDQVNIFVCASDSSEFVN